MKHVFAQAVTVDLVECCIAVDGIELPWYIREQPQFEVLEAGVIQMNVGILIDGFVMIKGQEGKRVIDPILGDVGEYARNKVRAEFIRAFPWLRDV